MNEESLPEKFVKLALPVDFEFMQDNAPIHKTKIVQDFFDEIAFYILTHPPLSPDLNPIEHVWEYMYKCYAKLNLARLYEVDATGQDASNKAENFNKADGVWSAPVSSSRDGVNTTTYTYSTVVAVGKPKDAKTAQFNMTAVVYDTNGTAWNGNQTVNVAAGAIKFSISLGPWPFLADTNKLRFGVRVETKSKNETTPKSKGEKHEGKRDPKNGKIDRMDLGDTMYLDSPAQAVVDGANVEIWSNVDASPDGAIVQWEFPHYTNTLYYDPVLGSTDPTVTDTGATTPVPTTSKPNDVASTSYAAVWAMTVCAAIVATAGL
ncbi:hypothetical protein H310_10073 [Aphanomyces invadans]|uniref:Tc1-like transposase DDE domain-containing protein n=1 Tax=Aphanomyces invadans TaxID=157072 RepID=A0A024TRI4_9STRA|nr:hypothetical protein H310_10073 [Aphanomyces invadans]ETV96765.1 hypothetical protein H310_10073 [Aphanomyces invadans]|eukprot:XP_008874542.1 hypothetical protein H310_10073 [Aphanomyces invadans]